MAIPEAEEGVLELSDPLPPDPEEHVPAAAAPALRLPGAGMREEGMWAQEDPDREADERRPRRLWPWLVAPLVIAAILLGLVWTGLVRPERYGLPAVALPPIELPAWADPAQLNIVLPNVRVPTTPPPPLSLSITANRRDMGNGRLLWDVRGTVSNPTTQTYAVPPVDLILTDNAGAPVSRWTVRLPVSHLAPGASAGFESSSIDPPASAARVRASLKASGLGRM